MSLLRRMVGALRKRRDDPRRQQASAPDSAARHRRNFLMLLHPHRVRADSLRTSATFGLGLAAGVLLVIVVVTGVLLMFHYVPTTDPDDGAYASIQELRHAVPFGQFMRNMHRWSAHLLVVVMFLHMCRVFLRGAFKPPRRFNWVIGVLLMALILAEGYTGYLLPWDQLSYWAVEVGSRMMSAVPWVGETLRRLVLGGDEIGQAALIRFYTLHCIVLPIPLALLLVAHLWRVRQDGGLAHRSENEDAPMDPRPRTVAAWPHLVLRELAIVLVCLLVVIVMSLLWDAPFGEPADSAHAPQPAKAAWYFLWLQELVSYDYGSLTHVRWPPWNPDGATLGSEFWGGVLVPTVGFLVLLLVPYASSRRRGVGIYFARGRRTACTIFCVIWAAIIVLIVVGYFFRGPDWRLVWPF